MVRAIARVFCGSPRGGGLACFSGQDADDSDFFRDSPGRTCRVGLYGAAGGDQAEAHRARQDHLQARGCWRPCVGRYGGGPEGGEGDAAKSPAGIQADITASWPRMHGTRLRLSIARLGKRWRRCGFFWRRRIRPGWWRPRRSKWPSGGWTRGRHDFAGSRNRPARLRCRERMLARRSIGPRVLPRQRRRRSPGNCTVVAQVGLAGPDEAPPFEEWRGHRRRSGSRPGWRRRCRGLRRRSPPSGPPQGRLAGTPSCRRSFAWEDQEKTETGSLARNASPSGGFAERGDPRVRAIVAEKQLSTELLDAWTG